MHFSSIFHPAFDNTFPRLRQDLTWIICLFHCVQFCIKHTSMYTSSAINIYISYVLSSRMVNFSSTSLSLTHFIAILRACKTILSDTRLVQMIINSVSPYTDTTFVSGAVWAHVKHIQVKRASKSHFLIDAYEIQCKRTIWICSSIPLSRVSTGGWRRHNIQQIDRSTRDSLLRGKVFNTHATIIFHCMRAVDILQTYWTHGAVSLVNQTACIALDSNDYHCAMHDVSWFTGDPSKLYILTSDAYVHAATFNLWCVRAVPFYTFYMTPALLRDRKYCTLCRLQLMSRRAGRCLHNARRCGRTS